MASIGLRETSDGTGSRKYSAWTPRFMASIAGISIGTGMIVGTAISNGQPILLIALATLSVGYSLNILEQREHARSGTTTA